jgi:flagellar basal body rod protein FlgG
MNIGLYQSAASLSALERWQAAVSQNITSSQVPGFKKRTVEFSTLEMGEIQPDPKSKLSSGDTQHAMFPQATVGVSFQPGETQPTRRDFDVALQGEGFFEVKMPDGTRGYTRAGALHARGDHTLVGADENPILAEGGGQITLQPQGGNFMVSPDGTITQGENQLGKFSVVRFPASAKLVPVGGGTFLAANGVQPVPVDKPQVLQGYIEGSNVTPLNEMIALVQIARAYEANQKIITSRDQNMQKALETLG